MEIDPVLTQELTLAQTQAMLDATKDDMALFEDISPPVVISWHPGIELFDLVSLRNPNVRSGMATCVVRKLIENLDPRNPTMNLECSESVSLFQDRWLTKELVHPG